MADVSDAEVAAAIRSAQTGDSKAIDLLLRLFHADVRRACDQFRLEADQELSHSDLQQEAWMRVWSRISSFRGAETPESTVRMFRSWLQTTSANVVRNLLSRGRIRASADPLSTIVAKSPSPSSVLRSDESQARLLRHLADLPTEQRQVIECCFLEGLSLKAAAARLKLTYDQARYRFSEALDQLKSRLSDPDGS